MKKVKERKQTVSAMNNHAFSVQPSLLHPDTVPEMSLLANNSVGPVKKFSKRVVRNKTTLKETKHTLTKPNKMIKANNLQKKKLPNGQRRSSLDSQANKENNTPGAASKNKKFGLNKANWSNQKKTPMKVYRKPMSSNSKSKKKNFKKSPEKVVQIAVSEEDQTSKPSVKRVSLKKKTQALSNESASKVSINESIKEQECIKTPSSSRAPKNSYGLRRTKRGRKPKKSHVYNSAENLIYSHEKEEEMNKLGDSEFKLPNEEKNKLKLEVSQSKTVLLHDQSESDQDINMSEDHTGMFKIHQFIILANKLSMQTQ